MDAIEAPVANDAAVYIRRKRLIVYAFCMLVGVLIACMSGGLWALHVGDISTFQILIAVDLASMAAACALCANVAYERLLNETIFNVCAFNIFFHLFAFGMQLVMVGLLIGNRVNFKCGNAPQDALTRRDADLLTLYPEDVCRLHDGVHALVWVNYVAFAVSLTLCILEVDDYRRFARKLFCMPAEAEAEVTPIIVVNYKGKGKAKAEYVASEDDDDTVVDPEDYRYHGSRDVRLSLLKEFPVPPKGIPQPSLVSHKPEEVIVGRPAEENVPGPSRLPDTGRRVHFAEAKHPRHTARAKAPGPSHFETAPLLPPGLPRSPPPAYAAQKTQAMDQILPRGYLLAMRPPRQPTDYDMSMVNNKNKL